MKRLLFTLTIFIFVTLIGFFIAVDEESLQYKNYNLIVEDSEDNKEKIELSDQNQTPIDSDINSEPQIAGISTEESVDSNLNQSNQVNEEIAEVEEATEILVSDQIPENNNLFLVTRVVDGDTIELETGEKIRYIGVDAPETVHPSKPVGCFGKEASSKNRELVENKYVRLENDITDRDKYARLLRYVYLEDGTFINLKLVEEGYATSYTYPPDVKYQDQFTQAEAQARQTHLGLWGSDCSKSCDIKGNISASGEKIYHLPGQKYYNTTVIDESKDEKWFCHEKEATEAGWRKSKI